MLNLTSLVMEEAIEIGIEYRQQAYNQEESAFEVEGRRVLAWENLFSGHKSTLTDL